VGEVINNAELGKRMRAKIKAHKKDGAKPDFYFLTVDDNVVCNDQDTQRAPY